MSGCKSLLNNNPSLPVNFSAFSSESAAQLFACERECSRLSDADSVDADRLSLIVANIKDLNPFPNYLPDIMQYRSGTWNSSFAVKIPIWIRKFNCIAHRKLQAQVDVVDS